MYTITLQIAARIEGSHLFFKKRIELPFPPYDGLRIKISDKQTVPLENVEWDLGKGEFTSTNVGPMLPGMPVKSKEVVISDFMGWGWTLEMG